MCISPITEFRTGTEAVPGTVGIIVDLERTEFKSTAAWVDKEISAFYKLYKDTSTELRAAAKGKVILIDRTESKPKSICFQANGSLVKAAWCGNASAATAAYLNSTDSNTLFEVSNGATMQVDANVNPIENGEFMVSQNWELEKQFKLNEKCKINGGSEITLNFLNDYRINISDTVSSFENSCQWEIKHQSDLGPNQKVCVLHPPSGRVKYITSSYVHKSAPITGLCTLAFLQQRLPWLAKRMKTNTVVTSRGELTLPKVQLTDNTIKINVNPIQVNLKKA
ncbi:hypothetical protein [Winogradskyella tangerina]|uniref:hypothetical protein n=1 Tax=Winogradskyella tangerina TaxID=2023240 RepID=UPI000DBEA39D|nr:hypothetical protein [Winogradskyella tangerina]